MSSPPIQDPSETRPESDLRPAPERLGVRNWACFLAGAALMAIGYVFLGLAGREAAGPFGRSAPFLIVGGLAVFGLGFVPRGK